MTLPSREPCGEAITFILDLGRALQQYGTPAHQVEATLMALCKRVGRRAEFFSTPTSLMAMIDRQPGSESVAHLVRINAGVVQLDKLSLVDEIAEGVVRGTLSFTEAAHQVKNVATAPPPYGASLVLPAYGVASAGVALSFGGGWLEVAAGGAIGVLVGSIAASMARSRSRHVVEFIAAFVASAAAIIAAHWVGVDPVTITLAALISILPGLSLTVAVSELAWRELVSGTARLMSALTVLLEMAIGVVLARQLLPAPPALFSHSGLPWWVTELATIGTVLSLVVLFQVPRNAFAVVSMVCVVGFYSARWGAGLTSPLVGPCLGAFCVGTACNLYERHFNRPAMIPLVPALALLVPGAISFSGLAAVVDAKMVTGMQSLAAGLVVTANIVVGLLIANVIAPARRIL